MSGDNEPAIPVINNRGNNEGAMIAHNNEPIILERKIKGTVVTVNKLKHYAFIKRKDKTTRDIFAREASIIREANQKRFFISDSVQFDVMKTARGVEAVNIEIVQRHMNSIEKLPKIPKKKQTQTNEQHISTALFTSTMVELFREALKNKK
ncbi:unnamed protein product [Adineta steineri]|uniref:CSD domain-containing protein n=1 Tax=Adineta steineri TaxID=433720 RepID=A0A819RFS9_9BILA|nr:unnamed protein product [Adineta steineri]CAF4038319.1 unnamed protein product [Adineta steineri]